MAAPAIMAWRSPITVVALLAPLATSAMANSSAAPKAAPTWRAVLITPPTTPWSRSATPATASTVAPKTEPAVPNPTSVTAANAGLYEPWDGRRVKMRNPTVAAAPVSTRSRRTPNRAARRAPNTPATKPTTPWGAMAMPVARGESWRDCCR